MAGTNDRESFHALGVIKTRGPISRKSLSEAMRMGEGRVRVLLDRLDDAGLVERRKRGTVLSKRGERALAGLEAHRIVIDLQGLAMDIYNVAILVRGGAKGVRSGLEQRDEAIRGGAKGATTLVCKNGRMWLPAHPGPQPVKPEITRYLKKALEPRGGDAVVIGSGPDYDAAEAGALYGARLLFDFKL